MDKILVMGRKTYEGMGKLSLPYRHIIVLTTQKDFKVEKMRKSFIRLMNFWHMPRIYLKISMCQEEVEFSSFVTRNKNHLANIN